VVLLWLNGVVVFCRAVVGNIEGMLINGGGYAGIGMGGGIVGTAGIASMGGIGKKPLNCGWGMNGSGCT
jgi:hypothetical protein